MHHAGATRCVSGGCDDRFYRTLDLPSLPALIIPANVDARDLAAQLRRPSATPRPAPAIPASIAGYSPAPLDAPSLPAGIDAVGVELECIVGRRRAPALDAWVRGAPRGTVGYDGSLRADSPSSTTREYTYWSNSLPDLEAWLDAAFGRGARTNATCGFHVHVKPALANRWVYATRYYWQAFEAAYYDFAAALPEEHRQLYARRGTNYFCAFNRWGRERVMRMLSPQGLGSRYNAVNLHSLVRHGYGTVEHRILPGAPDARTAKASLRWLVETAGALTDLSRIKVPTGPLERGALASCAPLWDGRNVEAALSTMAAALPEQAPGAAMVEEA